MSPSRTRASAGCRSPAKQSWNTVRTQSCQSCTSKVFFVFVAVVQSSTLACCACPAAPPSPRPTGCPRCRPSTPSARRTRRPSRGRSRRRSSSPTGWASARTGGRVRMAGSQTRVAAQRPRPFRAERPPPGRPAPPGGEARPAERTQGGILHVLPVQHDLASARGRQRRRHRQPVNPAAGGHGRLDPDAGYTIVGVMTGHKPCEQQVPPRSVPGATSNN